MKVHNIPSLNPLQLFRSPIQQPQQQAGRAGPRAEPRGHIPKNSSLLFELELEDVPVRAESQDDPETQGILTNFRTLAVPWSKTETELLAEWVATQDVQHDNSEALTALAKRLRSLGHLVSIRTALGGGWGGECLRNLRHSFLVCTVKGEEGTAVYIVDPAFREQFDLAHATPRYQQILNAIPTTFVGTEERLVALVRALCQEIQSVFSEQNATLPPWRDVAAQLSKWRPRHSMDRPISQQEDGDKARSYARPGHDLKLVRTVTEGSAQLGEAGRTALGKSLSLPPLALDGPAKSASLKRTSADPTSASASSSSKSGTILYQRMAWPVAGTVQQLMSRSAQSGLLVPAL